MISVDGSLEERVRQATGLSLAELQARIKTKKTKPMIDLIANVGCNKSCERCFLGDLKQRDKFTDFEKAKELASGLKRQGYQVYWYPSEATVCPESIDTYTDASMTRALTNGIEIGKNPALLEHYKAAGIKELKITLSDDILVKKAIQLASKDFDVSTFFVVDKNTINSIGDACRSAYALGAKRVTLLKFRPFGNGASLRELCLDKEDVKTVVKEVDKLRGEYDADKLRISLSSGWGPNFFGKSVYCRLADENSEYKTDCSAGRGFMSCYLDGKDNWIYPCFMFTNEEGLRLGKLENGVPKVKLVEDILEKIKEPCASCNYLPLCEGGCRASAYASTGDFYAGMDDCLTNVIEEIRNEHC